MTLELHVYHVELAEGMDEYSQIRAPLGSSLGIMNVPLAPCEIKHSEARHMHHQADTMQMQNQTHLWEMCVCFNEAFSLIKNHILSLSFLSHFLKHN